MPEPTVGPAFGLNAADHLDRGKLEGGAVPRRRVLHLGLHAAVAANSPTITNRRVRFINQAPRLGNVRRELPEAEIRRPRMRELASPAGRS